MTSDAREAIAILQRLLDQVKAGEGFTAGQPGGRVALGHIRGAIAALELMDEGAVDED